MTDAVECQLAKAAVKTRNGQDRVSVVKNARRAVVKGDVELVAQAKRLGFDADIGNARGVQTNDRAILLAALQLAVHQHPFGEFTVDAVKARTAKQAAGVYRGTLFRGFCKEIRATPSISSGRESLQSGSANTTTPYTGRSMP